jgi:2-keto-3-deoxy-L-rhamnonate aldolase RhmA
MTAFFNPFRRFFAENPQGTLLGSWLMSASAAPAEAMGHIGFDYLVVDMEHVTLDVSTLPDILRAIAATPTLPLVRLAWNDRVLIKRVLDAGAETIMLPFVQTAEEAREAVAAAKYPPVGTRGVAAMHRASRFGAVTDYLTRANDETFVIVQLETPEAVARIREIAAVPGVDGLFVGPNDLAAAIGRIGQIGHDEVQRLIAQAAGEARALGKPIGIVGPNPAMVRRFLGYGYNFCAVASDIGMMTGRARDWLAELRDTPESERTSGPAY